MHDLIEELRGLSEFKGDLKSQAVVLMGLPAAGKSTFIRNEMDKVVPGAGKAYSVANSDSQVMRLQKQTQNADFKRLKSLASKLTNREFANVLKTSSFKDNGGKTRTLQISRKDMLTMKRREFDTRTWKGYYAVYFDIRKFAADIEKGLFADKVRTSANVFVWDTVAAKSAKVLARLEKLRDEDRQITIIYLEVDPNLSIQRDAWRGENEGRTVGESVIRSYASQMEAAYKEYMRVGKSGGPIDRLYHFEWKPEGSSPIRGTWVRKAVHRFDVKRELAQRKKDKE